MRALDGTTSSSTGLSGPPRSRRCGGDVMIYSRIGALFCCDPYRGFPVLACEYGCHDDIDYREDRMTDDSPALCLVMEDLEYIANGDWPAGSAGLARASG